MRRTETAARKSGSRVQKAANKPVVRHVAAAAQGAQEGVRDAMGQSTAKSVGKFLKPTTGSDKTLGGDAKVIGSGAASGAKLGTKIGGAPGAAIGAVVGGTLQGLKTKTGRRLLFAMALFNPMTIILIGVLTLTMVVNISGAVQSENTQPESMSLSAAQADGVTTDEIQIASDTVVNHEMPWEVLVAIVHGEGNTLSKKRAATVPDDQINQNTPVAPYDLQPQDVDKAVLFRDTDDTDGSTAQTESFGFRTKHDVLANLSQSEESSEIVASLLDADLKKVAPRMDSYSLGAGVVYNDNGEGPHRVMDKSDSGQSTQAAKDVHDAYVAAISLLPIQGIAADAESIYNQALTWYLGTSGTCSGSQSTAAISGQWANPVNVAMGGDTFGQIGPMWSVRTHIENHPDLPADGSGGGYHNGTDFPAPIGTPVFAGGSGTVITGQQTSWGGPNMVIIDHGNGLETMYAHMSTMSVSNGQQVTAGTQIGTVGDLGNASGPHLHLSVFQTSSGEWLDPVNFFSQRGVTLGSASGSTSGAANATTKKGGSAPSTASSAPTSPSKSATTGATASTTTGVTGPAGSLPESFTATTADGTQVTLTQKQLTYAAQIAQVGQQKGVGDAGITVALVTVFQESHFQDLANDGIKGPEDTVATPQDLAVAALSMTMPHDGVGTDNDSVGLFQQRRSWGGGAGVSDQQNVQNRLDPTFSAGAFFDRLNAIPGWRTMTPGEAAQLVQGSAYPDAYNKWPSAAQQLLAQVRGLTLLGGSSQCGAGATVAVGGSGQTNFAVGDLNSLGAPHTDPKQIGDAAKQGYGPYTQRAPGEVSSVIKSGVTLIGYQEFDQPQEKLFKSLMGDGWDFYTGGSGSFENSLAWRLDTWTVVAKSAFRISWYAGHAMVPWVVLKNNSTGQQIVFMNTHQMLAGTASADGQYQADNRNAEIGEWTTKIAAQYPGTPIIFTGDMNDGQFICKFGPPTGAIDAGGSTYGDGHGCTVRNHADPTIWITSTKDVTWSAYNVDWSLRARKLTDHAYVTATASIGSAGASGTTAANPVVASAIAWAHSHVGDAYVWGADGPHKWDCSHFVHQAYAQAGYAWAYMVSEQQAAAGQPVGANGMDTSQLQPGDLIFYGSPAHHVALYIGNNQVIHAANPRVGVRVEDYTTAGGGSPISAIRRLPITSLSSSAGQ